MPSSIDVIPHEHMIQSQRSNSKRIGEILIDAHLLSPSQVQVALYDQRQYATLRLGEIAVFRGWLSQQTADFFGDQWHRVCSQPSDTRYALGTYLFEAGLVDKDGIEEIISEQIRNGYRFGTNAVLLGFIRQQTLDYFLDNLFPNDKDESVKAIMNKQSLMQSHPLNLLEELDHPDSHGTRIQHNITPSAKKHAPEKDTLKQPIPLKEDDFK